MYLSAKRKSRELSRLSRIISTANASTSVVKGWRWFLTLPQGRAFVEFAGRNGRVDGPISCIRLTLRRAQGFHGRKFDGGEQMRIAVALGALLLTCGAVFASGGLDCGSAEERATMALHGGVTRGMGGPLFQFEGRLYIADESIAEDLRQTTFEMPHVAQYWLDAEDLRLVLYRERQGDAPHGYVELIVKTKAAGDDIEYNGTYSFTAYDAGGNNGQGSIVTHTGKISCGAE
jgi:hypothetical protein